MSQISLPFPWDRVTPSSLLSRWVYAAFTVSVVFQEDGLLHTCVKPAPSNQKPVQNDLMGDSSPQLVSKHTTPTLGGAAASRTHVHGPPLPQGLRTDPSPCLGPSPESCPLGPFPPFGAPSGHDPRVPPSPPHRRGLCRVLGRWIHVCLPDLTARPQCRGTSQHLASPRRNVFLILTVARVPSEAATQRAKLAHLKTLSAGQELLHPEPRWKHPEPASYSEHLPDQKHTGN